LLVEFGRPIGLFDFVRLQRELGERLGRRVELVTRAALKPAAPRSDPRRGGACRLENGGCALKTSSMRSPAQGDSLGRRRSAVGPELPRRRRGPVHEGQPHQGTRCWVNMRAWTASTISRIIQAPIEGVIGRRRQVRRRNPHRRLAIRLHLPIDRGEVQYRISGCRSLSTPAGRL
jgi:hypothetical protein